MSYHYLALPNFHQKWVFVLTRPSIPLSLNQYRRKIGSFCDRLTSRNTELTISILSFAQNVSVYIILIVNTIFLLLLDQLSSCNIYFWNFMTLH